MQNALPNGRDRHGVVIDSSPPKATGTRKEMVLACMAFLGRGEEISLEGLRQKGFLQREILAYAETAATEAFAQWTGGTRSLSDR